MFPSSLWNNVGFVNDYPETVETIVYDPRGLPPIPSRSSLARFDHMRWSIPPYYPYLTY